MKVDVIVTDENNRRWFAVGVELEQDKDPSLPPPLPVDPAKPTRNRIIPGVHDQRAPADLVAAFPGVRITREFVAGVQNDPADLDGLKRKIERIARPSLDAGLEPIISVKLDVDQVLRGEWNATLRALGPWLLALGVRRFVPWHEPEDDHDGATFARYFKIIRDCVRTGAADLRVVYSAMAYQWAPKVDGRGSIAGRTDDVDAWQAIEADEYAVDVYSGRSFRLGQILPEHPGFVRWHFVMIGDTGRPWSVYERGFEAGPDKYSERADTIDRETDWLLDSPDAAGCVVYAYWATPGTEKSAPLDLDPSGERAVRDLVAGLAAATAGASS